MGLRFRKSFKLGPIRYTISKSGVSTSIGTKGYRVTKRADGKIQTTTSIPGTGISHVSVSSGKKSAPAPAPRQEEKKAFLDTGFGKFATVAIIIAVCIFLFWLTGAIFL